MDKHWANQEVQLVHYDYTATLNTGTWKLYKKSWMGLAYIQTFKSSSSLYLFVYFVNIRPTSALALTLPTLDRGLTYT